MREEYAKDQGLSMCICIYIYKCVSEMRDENENDCDGCVRESRKRNR